MCVFVTCIACKLKSDEVPFSVSYLTLFVVVFSK